MLRRFDGTRSPDEVHDRIRATLAAKRLEAELDVSVIHRKTPEEIEKMAAAGRVLVRCHEILRKKAPSRRDHRRAGRGRRALHPLAGRRARVQGLPRLPGLDLRLAELDGGARHPGLLPAPARRHPVGGHRRGARRLGGRRRDHHPIGNVTPIAKRLLATTKASLFDAVEQCVAGQPPRRRLARRPGARGGGRLQRDPLPGGPRDRPRHARGSADPELRRAGHGAASSRRAWCSRSSRW